MVEDSEFKKLSDDQIEINRLATMIVKEVLKKISKEEDLIEKTAYKAVKDAMKDFKTIDDIDQIRNKALNLVNQVINGICETDD